MGSTTLVIGSTQQFVKNSMGSHFNDVQALISKKKPGDSFACPCAKKFKGEGKEKGRLVAVLQENNCNGLKCGVARQPTFSSQSIQVTYLQVVHERTFPYLQSNVEGREGWYKQPYKLM